MKLNKTFTASVLALATLLGTAVVGRADLMTNAVAVDGYIRGGGSLTNVPSLTQTTTNGGIFEVKSGSTLGTAGGTRKAYFKFNLPANANTNANLVFNFVLSGVPQSQAQRIILWGLTQPYPGFSAATLTWSNAQANSTINSNLLASGAVVLAISNVVNSAVAADINRSLTLPGGQGGWGQAYIHSDNTITLAMTAITDGAYNNNSPIRILTNSESITFYSITTGNPPSISTVNDFSIFTGSTVATTNPFTVSDPDETSSNLVMSATSSDGTVVPSAYINFGGSGTNRYFYVTNGLAAGSCRITITATDSAGNPAQSNFKLTVLQTAPAVAGSHTNTLVNTAVGLSLKVTEPGNTNGSLNITVTATSGNPNVVLNSGISITGTGTNRTATVTPVAGADGVAPIIIISTDITNNVSSTNIYSVMVLPATNAVFSDHFDYTISSITGFDNLDSDSGDFWFTRAGGGGTHVKVSSGVCVLTLGPNVQSVIAPLKGGPYQPGSGTVFLTKFKATWTAAPASPDSGTFISLWDETAGSGTTGLRGRFSTTNSPVSGFNARIQTSEGALYTVATTDLQVGETHTFWIKYDVDGAQTTLWVDPANEASAHFVNSDLAGNRPIYDVSLRQGTDTAGSANGVLLDDLSVTITNRPIIAPVITSFTATTNQVVTFTGDTIDPSSAFTVLHATNVVGPYSNSGSAPTTLAPGSFRAIINDTAPERYYRIQRY